MRKLALFCGLVLMGGVAGMNPASAEVTGIKISFAGGCTAENQSGSCTLRIVASGSDLDTEEFELYTSDKSNTRMKRASLHNSSVGESGVGHARLRNRPGACFQLRTARNGDDTPDVYSRTICEAAAKSK